MAGDFDFTTEDRDVARRSRRSRRPASRPRSGFPVWGWLLLAMGVMVLGCGGSSIAAVVIFGRTAATAPTQKVSQLHQAWAGRSYHDWLREYGEGDRNDFVGYGGYFYYNRPLAISDRTGKPCGITARVTDGQVQWVMELGATN